MELFGSIGISFLKVFLNLVVNLSGSGLFFVVKCFITASISLPAIDLFILFISSWF
jgi:hypothetical protein